LGVLPPSVERSHRLRLRAVLFRSQPRQRLQRLRWPGRVAVYRTFHLLVRGPRPGRCLRAHGCLAVVPGLRLRRLR